MSPATSPDDTVDDPAKPPPALDTEREPLAMGAPSAPSVPALIWAAFGTDADVANTTKCAVPASSMTASRVMALVVTPVALGYPVANTGAVVSGSVVTLVLVGAAISLAGTMASTQCTQTAYVVDASTPLETAAVAVTPTEGTSMVPVAVAATSPASVPAVTWEALGALAPEASTTNLAGARAHVQRPPAPHLTTHHAVATYEQVPGSLSCTWTSKAKSCTLVPVGYPDSTCGGVWSTAVVTTTDLVVVMVFGLDSSSCPVQYTRYLWHKGERLQLGSHEHRA